MRTDVAQCESASVLHAAEQDRFAKQDAPDHASRREIARVRCPIPEIAQEGGCVLRLRHAAHFAGVADFSGGGFKRLSSVVMICWPLYGGNLCAQPDARESMARAWRCALALPGTASAETVAQYSCPCFIACTVTISPSKVLATSRVAWPSEQSNERAGFTSSKVKFEIDPAMPSAAPG